ncbi:MAG: ECF-type sigma factor [Dokdonella sp.]
MSEVTRLLALSRDGDAQSLESVFALLYSELHQLAEGRYRDRNETLTPTVLVHEAFLRLTANEALTLQDRRHFFACAARSMRCIVLDHARRRDAERRGGGAAPLTLGEHLVDTNQSGMDSDLLSLDQAMDRLDQFDERQRQVVELHFFAGLTFFEIGELLECSERTAKREWERARAFLHAELDSAIDAS